MATWRRPSQIVLFDSGLPAAQWARSMHGKVTRACMRRCEARHHWTVTRLTHRQFALEKTHQLPGGIGDGGFSS